MYCKKCGAKLIENDSFCRNCGTPVIIQNNVGVNQMTFNQQPQQPESQIQVQSQPMNQQMSQQSFQTGQPVQNYNLNNQQQLSQANNIQYTQSGCVGQMPNNIYSNSLDEKLLMAFIGDDYAQIIQQKFSFRAMYLNVFYVVFRKCYFISTIIAVLILLMAFVPENIFVIFASILAIVLGFYFDKMYVNHAKNKIKKIKLNNPNANEYTLINLCKEAGGTSTVSLIVFLLILVFVGMFLRMALGILS